MNNWFYTELLFPIISAGIGAVIGGLFAYKIAKEKFASDYINQGKTCALFIESVAKIIIEQSKDLQNCLNNRTQSCAEEFLPVLYEKNKLLEENISRYVLHWNHDGEKLFCCTLKHICKNPRKRNQYSIIYEEINSTNYIIINYQGLVKKYFSLLKRDGVTGEITNIAFYNSQESNTMLQSAGNYLRRLEEDCTKIINICNKIK